MWRWIVAMLLVCTGVANPQQQKEAEHPFPTEDRIQLLLTQSERAFDIYEQVVEQEAQAGGNIAKAVPKDREVLSGARNLLARLKKSPNGFNGPAGFILVGDLDDGSRNMSLCAVGGTEGQKYVSVARACLDASALLYTVSEVPFNMYSEFLLAREK